MNFFHPLLQTFQWRFNFSSDRQQPTINLLNSNVKQEETDQPTNSLLTMTQQELLQRQFTESAAQKLQLQQILEQQEPIKTISKKISKKANTCGHPDKEHYAKGMCNNCYHRLGRNKQPWLCNHKKLYACGLCQNCYINQYNKKRRTETQEGHQLQEQSEQNEPQLSQEKQLN